MRCEICGASVMRGAALHRVNPIGELPAKWRCKKCLTPEQLLTRDPIATDIVEIIEEDNRTKGGQP